MQGYIYNGWYELASQFPASLNTEDDPTKLKPYESPACYGIDCTKEDRLASGSIPSATTRSAPTKSIGSTTYNWYYNRLWLSSSDILYWGAPFYDTSYFPHGLGKLQFDANIVTFMPCLQDQMWILTATGSYFISNARSNSESDFVATQFVQGLIASTATHSMTIGEMPVVSNTQGVFMWDGSKVVELTKPVRSSLGSFTANAITADYVLKRIVASGKFAIDVSNGKLFDYGTAGFLYTTPTLAQAKGGYGPLTVNSIAIAYEMITAGDATIEWQSKAEDNDWFVEEPIEIKGDQPEKTRVEREILNPNRTAHKMSFRITALSSNVAIKSINVNVAGLAVEGASE